MQVVYYKQAEQFMVIIWALNKNMGSLSNNDKRETYKRFLQEHLKVMCDDERVQLYYNDKGKPFITSSQYKSISISHTLNFFCVQLHHERYAGIDIETVRDTLMKIQTKFLQDEEILMAKDDLDTLCLMWTCKEALFKVHGEEGVSLKQHIRISKIDLPYISASIFYKDVQEHYTLYTHYIKPLRITYVVKKD